MSRKIILIKQELLLLVYELNRSGLLAEMRKFDLSLRSSRSSYFATFRHQLTILSKTDALDEEKWLNVLGTFVKDWFRYESHFVHGRDSLVELDRKSGSAGMPRPISYAVFCLQKKGEERGGDALHRRPDAVQVLQGRRARVRQLIGRLGREPQAAVSRRARPPLLGLPPHRAARG